MVALSHRFGEDPEYTRGGGGNISVKADGVLYIKPSGTSLATLTAQSVIALDVGRCSVARDAHGAIRHRARHAAPAGAPRSVARAPRWPGHGPGHAGRRRCPRRRARRSPPVRRIPVPRPHAGAIRPPHPSDDRERGDLRDARSRGRPNGSSARASCGSRTRIPGCRSLAPSAMRGSATKSAPGRRAAHDPPPEPRPHRRRRLDSRDRRSLRPAGRRDPGSPGGACRPSRGATSRGSRPERGPGGVGRGRSRAARRSSRRGIDSRS